MQLLYNIFHQHSPTNLITVTIHGCPLTKSVGQGSFTWQVKSFGFSQSKILKHGLTPWWVKHTTWEETANLEQKILKENFL